MPGFIDTHTHAPQTVNAGLGLDLPLLEWLEKYTFPQESKFQNIDFANLVYPAAVRRHVSYGTTTCCYYATIHLEASKRLVDIIETIGQRAFVGKVNMDRNSPSILIESTKQSLEDTQAFIDYVKSKSNTLITPVVTPRFAPSCTPELLGGLSKIAADQNLPIQSHIGENLNEIKWVAELFPESSSYAAVYDNFGLLTPKTIMAHCIYLTDEEIELMKKRQVGVSHCASSNFGLASGVCPVRDLVQAGIKVSLGSDVSGGYSPSMLDAIRQSIVASKVTNINARSKVPLSVGEAFYLATVGGAQVCGIDDTVGNITVGKEFDAVLVDLLQFHQVTGAHGPYDVNIDDHVKALNSHIAFSHANIDLWDHDTLETRFERFVYLGDDRNISKVWVKGRLIKKND